jgi:hypothetical protein
MRAIRMIDGDVALLFCRRRQQCSGCQWPSPTSRYLRARRMQRPQTLFRKVPLQNCNGALPLANTGMRAMLAT